MLKKLCLAAACALTVANAAAEVLPAPGSTDPRVRVVDSPNRSIR